MSPERRSRSTAGFTVVEMLVAVSIMMMVSVPILMVLRSANSADVAQTAKIDASRNGAIAAERLSADIRSATAITITSAGVLQLTVKDVSGAKVAVTWRRTNADLVRTSTVGAVTSSTVVLSDLLATTPATPFTAYDKNGNQVLAAAVNCPGYVHVDIERVAPIRSEHLVFDVASRSLNAGTASC